MRDISINVFLFLTFLIVSIIHLVKLFCFILVKALLGNGDLNKILRSIKKIYDKIFQR